MQTTKSKNLVRTVVVHYVDMTDHEHRSGEITLTGRLARCFSYLYDKTEVEESFIIVGYGIDTIDDLEKKGIKFEFEPIDNLDSIVTLHRDVYYEIIDCD